mmetsp:Transcript_9258/g.33941  ORF Transcript_9258/g.33941 Transcript_9258/m.33941 type:complete len:511 (+) Transcript_9258:234-1766(+)
MVVLAASVLAKSGKVLVSRQFVEMTRIRIEGLLAAFPKLVGTGKQHTYVETENVRYVYQPMEGIYLVLVTNKQSNILEDLETLRMLAKLIPEYTQALDEESINGAAFDLIFAFDEVISLGHKENVTVQQVKQYTEMESHEEKLHKMIIQSKINDTKDVMKKKASEIDKTKLDKKIGGGIEGGSMGLGMQSSFQEDPFASKPLSRPEPAFERPSLSTQASSERSGSSMPKKGMQLGKSKGSNAFLDALKADEELLGEEPERGPAAPPVPQEEISIAVEEKVSCSLLKDGGMENLEIQGTMSLEVLSEESSCIKILLEQGDVKGFQFKTHPNIDKQAYNSQGVLGLKDPNRPFPTGSPLGVLKWRKATEDESMVPLAINCWPSVSGGETYVNIEYEAQENRDLHNVLISIPVPAGREPPTVNQIDGDYRFNARAGTMEWEIQLIDQTNLNGSMEFVLPMQADTNAFFPIDVHFSSHDIFCEVKAARVVTATDETPVKYALSQTLIASDYQVV